MLKLQIKVAPPKKEKKRNTSGVTLVGKSKHGTCFIDESGTYKVSISMKNDPDYPDLLIVPFTERSYNLTGRKSVFTRTTDSKGRRTRIIRSESQAKYFPGDPERYTPFAPRWIVKGHIARENGVLKFDFDDLVTIEGYEMVIHDEEE